MAYIKLKDAINEVLTLRDCSVNSEEKLAFSLVYRKLRELPTADVAEVMHGEWEIGEFNKTRQIVVVECSECNCVLELPMSTYGLIYNYCPNCGAKMDGGKI